jgi:hypothetical protein
MLFLVICTIPSRPSLINQEQDHGEPGGPTLMVTAERSSE